MKKMITAVAVIAFVTGATACSNGAEADKSAATIEAGISGTWVGDLDTVEFENANSKYVIADGKYTCDSCLPPYSIAADGKWQKVDRPGVDELMMSIVDEKTIQFASRFKGEDTGKSTWNISEDGKTLTVDWTEFGPGGVSTGKSGLIRVAAGPAGSHPASGEWKPESVSEMSEESRTITVTENGTTFTVSGMGDGYTATLGGEPVPLEGSRSGVMVAVVKTGDNSYRETFTRNGETVGTTDWTVDGNVLTAVSVDPRDNSKSTVTARRK
jgi:hypothetical protein